MIDVSAWISAGAAVISVAMTGVTIWWPWHTRSLPSFTQRRITLRHADERLVPLIVACGFRRPFLFAEWRNDGDGPAHAVKVTSDSACDIRLMVEGPQFEHGYDLVDDVALLNPGESFVAIILPTSGTDLESVDAVLEYCVRWTSAKDALPGSICARPANGWDTEPPMPRFVISFLGYCWKTIER